MFTILSIFHVIVCVILILMVLLQAGKGADIGAVFGGGSTQTLFGARGAQTFLGKMTTISAILFMASSLTLAYLSSTSDADLRDLEERAREGQSEVVDEGGAAAAAAAADEGTSEGSTGEDPTASEASEETIEAAEPKADGAPASAAPVAAPKAPAAAAPKAPAPAAPEAPAPAAPKAPAPAAPKTAPAPATP